MEFSIGSIEVSFESSIGVLLACRDSVWWVFSLFH